MKRTMYQAARHTPKRGVGGSNPLWDAKNSAESLDLSRFSAFLIYPNPCLSNYHTAYQVVCLFMSCNEYFANWTRTKISSLLIKTGFLLICFQTLILLPNQRRQRLCQLRRFLKLFNQHGKV